MSSGWWLRWSLVGRRFPRTVVVAALVLAGFAIDRAGDLRIDSDVLAAAPEGVPELEDLAAVTSVFGGLDRLVVILEASSMEDRAAVEEVGVELGSWLRLQPAVARVESDLPALDEVVAFLAPRLPALLSVDEARALAAATQPVALESAARALRLRLAAPGAEIHEPLLRADPFGFSMPLLARSGRGSLAGALPEGARMLGSGAIASPGSELVVLVARPRHPARDVRSSADLLGAIRTETERLAEEYDLSGRVEVGFAGPHALAAEDADAIRRDLSRTTLIAAVAILVVFLWGFRGWRSLLAAALPLLVAVALTAGTAALLWGLLSTVAAAAAALLLGLGVDFAIVVLASEPEGQEESDPLWTALEQAGPGVVIGGLTTIATFGAFGAAHFRGLRELGWVVAVGVAWSLISVLLLLPALAGRPVPRRGSLRLGRWLIDTGLWRPRTMFGLWGAVVVVGVVLAPRVAFEGSLSGLRSSTTAAVRWQQRLSSLAGWDSTSMTLGIEASDGIEVQQAVHQAANVLAPLLGEELVAVSSPLVWLPGASEQRAGLAAFAGSGPNPSLRRDGEAALVRAGLRPEPFVAALDRWAEGIAHPREVSLEALARSPLGPSLHSFLVEEGGHFFAAMHLTLPPERFRSSAPPRLEALVAQHEIGRLAGLNRVSQALRREVRRDLWACGTLALTITCLLLAADLRSVAGVLAALLPVGPAIAGMVLVSVAFGIEFSFLALFAVVMLVGIGVDYGVHIVHRWRVSPGDSAALGATARGVLLAAATTVGGFGSLAFSSFPGLRAVGIFVAVGVACAALAALTGSPALLRRAGRAA